MYLILIYLVTFSSFIPPIIFGKSLNIINDILEKK